MSEPAAVYVTSLERLVALLRAGDDRAALRMASRWPRLGQEGAAIRAGWDAAAHPGFYVQVGKDPEALVRAGVAALRRRYQGHL